MQKTHKQQQLFNRQSLFEEVPAPPRTALCSGVKTAWDNGKNSLST
jgi:hypothetical protein